MSMPNTQSYLDRIRASQASLISQENDIKEEYGNLGFSKVKENGFSKTNLIEDLSNNVSFGIAVDEEMHSLGTVGDYNVVSALPLKGYTKNGVSYADPQDPSKVLSSTINNTVATDRADGNININRWTSRNIFKFTSDQYGYDRCNFKIPLATLANGIVIDSETSLPHANTLKNYPYPEEIIMTYQNSDKNFIHFINVQYTDSHYGHYNGKNYNLMIVKDRTRYGVLNDEGTAFKTYTSIYTNDVTTELAYIKDGYFYMPIPDEVYGEELLDTLWDCRVVWRSDAPDRSFTISSSLNYTKPNWSSISGISGACDVAYGNGKYVMISSSSKTCAYSTDGINWTSVTINSTSGNYYSIEFGNGKFVITTGYPSTSTYALYSTDGVNWTETTVSSTARNWYRLCFGGNTFIMTCYDSSKVIAYSMDGITWKEATVSSNARAWRTICYGNGKFVMMGDASTTAAYSTDGITWTESTVGSTTRFWSVCYGNGKFVATGYSSSTLAYSTDAVTWTVISNNLGSNLINGLAYGNGYFVASIASNSRYAYSVDGINWFAGYVTDSTSTREWKGVCFANGRFYMFFNSSSCYTGTDPFSLSLFNDINCCDGRLYGIDSSKITMITSNRNSIIGMNTQKSNIHTMYSSIFGSYSAINVAPTFNSAYTPKVDDEIPWLVTGAPNQVFRISDDYYIGFYYYNTTSRGARVPSSDFDNHTSQLYWCLFNNAFRTVNPLTSTSSATIYPCREFLSTFTNTQKILRIFRDDINYQTGVSSFYVATQTGIYRFTFTLSGSTVTASVESVNTFSFTALLIMRISNNEFLVYANATIHKVIIGGAVSTLNSSAPYMLLGRNIYAKIGTDSYYYPSYYDSNMGSIAKSAQSINPTARKNIIGMYGLFTNSAGNVLCKLDETFSFDKPLMSNPSYNRWTESMISTTNRYWKSICYGNGKFVAMEYSGTHYAYSTDGITWTEGTISSASKYWNAICYGNGKFVAIASGTNCAYSTDGITWTVGTLSLSSEDWQSVCYGNGKYVAVAFGSSNYAYSSDGINWTLNQLSNRETSWDSICYGDDKFVAITYLSNSFAYSTDGINWTEDMISEDYLEWNSICYGDGKFVIIAANSNIAAYSEDGTSWTQVTIGTSDPYWQSVCYGDGKFIAVNSDSINYAYSNDGINWTVDSLKTNLRNLRSVCYGNNRFVAVGNTNYFEFMDEV